jgi:hypothetical protein
MKEYGRFTAQKVGFSYRLSELLVAKVQALKSETWYPIGVRTLQQVVELVAYGLEDGPDGPAEAKVSKFLLARSPNDYAVIADRGTTLCNRPDARVSRSGCALVFYEVLVAGSEA